MAKITREVNGRTMEVEKIQKKKLTGGWDVKVKNNCNLGVHLVTFSSRLSLPFRPLTLP